MPIKKTKYENFAPHLNILILYNKINDILLIIISK